MARKPQTKVEKALAELRRERQMRRTVYPRLTGMGKLHPDKAKKRNDRLQMAIELLEEMMEERTGTQSELFT